MPVWLPAKGLKDKAHEDRAPYDIWRQKGFLEVVPGPVIEYGHVAKAIRKSFERYEIRKFAYDRWRMQALVPYLKLEGVDESLIDERFESFGQGFKSMSPACRGLERLLASGKIRHGGNPILRWNAANAMAKVDPAENIKLVKKHEAQRIDGIIALAMAIGVMEADIGERRVESIYETRAPLVI